MILKNINRFQLLIFTLIGFLFFLGCEENDKGPITSDEITITINSINQSDINDQGIVEKDENISNDSGNPWGEFIKEAEAECGSDPRRLEIVSVSVRLVGKEGVNVFEDVINGNASVDFINTQGSDTDAIRVPIGSSSNLSGDASNQLSNLASSADLGILLDRLLGGDFHVGFSGQTHLTDDDSFAMDVVVKFVVKAFCD